MKAAGNQTKLFELLVLDDDEVEELALTGQTGELKLDDIACMSVKELRKALREARADNQADKELLAEKNAALDAERARRLFLENGPPDAALAELKKDVDTLFNATRGAITGQLRQALLALNNHDPRREDRPLAYMAGVIAQLSRDLLILRDEFDLPAIDVDEHGWIEAGE